MIMATIFLHKPIKILLNYDFIKHGHFVCKMPQSMKIIEH